MNLIAAITGIAAVIGGIVYLVKLGAFAFLKTPERKAQDIQSQVAAEQHKAEETGRPE